MWRVYGSKWRIAPIDIAVNYSPPPSNPPKSPPRPPRLPVLRPNPALMTSQTASAIRNTTSNKGAKIRLKLLLASRSMKYHEQINPAIIKSRPFMPPPKPKICFFRIDHRRLMLIQCPMPNAQCPMLNAQCSMLNAQCSMLNAANS